MTSTKSIDFRASPTRVASALRKIAADAAAGQGQVLEDLKGLIAAVTGPNMCPKCKGTGFGPNLGDCFECGGTGMKAAPAASRMDDPMASMKRVMKEWAAKHSSPDAKVEYGEDLENRWGGPPHPAAIWYSSGPDVDEGQIAVIDIGIDGKPHIRVNGEYGWLELENPEDLHGYGPEDLFDRGF